MNRIYHACPVIHGILENKEPHLSFEKRGFWRSAIATSLKVIDYFLDSSIVKLESLFQNLADRLNP
jgi:hypothetical protein